MASSKIIGCSDVWISTVRVDTRVQICDAVTVAVANVRRTVKARATGQSVREKQKENLEEKKNYNF